jgi:D-proline reductase (dithiol) PrdB
MSVDGAIAYLPRIRSYYAALGYGAPYVWAQETEVPFQPLRKPLRESRIALVTTAAPYQPDKGDQGPGAPYNAAAKFYQVYSGSTATDPDLRISHLAIDRQHTTAADQNSYFPLPALRRAAATGRIGPIAANFFGLPTNRSQRSTLEADAPDLVNRVKLEGADAALLIANCPVCHQSVSLAACALERANISTVVMGCARDIVGHVGAPRFLFSDFPLGNAAGKPHDLASQDTTLAFALNLLEYAQAPRATFDSPLMWSHDPAWKRDYSNIDLLPPAEIARRRAEFDRGKEQASALRSRL